MHELSVLADAVAGCTKCRLAEGRTQVVFGSGHPQADLMFVGGRPASTKTSRAFPSSPAGKLLDKLLAGIGLTRSDVFARM
jgi:DNA polymerase